ncbi:hypothetical protein V8D89_000018 [Ganoderma adspersum]
MPRLGKVKRLLQDLRGYRAPEPPRYTHPAEALAALVQERIEVDAERLEAASLSNRSLPIHHLPNELLTRIFFLVCFKRPLSLGGPQAKDMDRATRTKLMLVCRYWREVALATPMMWRFLEMGRHVYLTKLALERSDPATIDVDICRNYIFPEEFELLYQHAHRIRRLDFYDCDHKHQSSVLDTLFDLGMPALEELSLFRSPFVSPRLANQVDIPTELSFQQYPHLRMLCLSRITMPRDPLLYSKLHTLVLIDCHCDYSFNDFLDILSSCSSTLRKLSLVSFLDRLSDNGTAPSKAMPRRSPISLPRVRDMALRKHLSCYSSHFLANLSLPSNAYIEIHAEGGIFSRDDPQAMANRSLRYAIPPDHTTTFPVLRAIVRVELDTQTYTLRGATRWSGTSYPLELKYSPSQRPVPGGYAPFASERELLPRSLDDLVALFQGSSLRCLSIRGVSFLVSQAKWLEVLRAFPRLEELRVSDNGPMVGLVGALQWFEPYPTPDEHDAGRVSPYACPKLRLLALELQCDLYSTLLGLLTDCVQFRAEEGLRLHKLEVRSFSPADVIDEDWCSFVWGLEGLVKDVSYEFQPASECGTSKTPVIYW